MEPVRISQEDLSVAHLGYELSSLMAVTTDS
jgi:hypothetical protein